MSVTIVARCVHGIEWVCADEIASRLDTTPSMTLARRELTFTVPAIDGVLLGLRTVDDVFIKVGEVEGVGTTKDVPAMLARLVARLPFQAALADVRTSREIPGCPTFDVVASIEGRRNYNRYAVENAVGTALAPRLLGSYLERTSQGRRAGEPDLTVRLFVRETLAIAAIRLGRRPLHRRDYKRDTGPATLHPPMAAALASLVGASPPAVLLDPFCGDATIAIESALSYPDAIVVGSDIDPVRLANATRNAERAGVKIALVRSDVADPSWHVGSVDAVVTNPPWNLAVDAGGRLRGTLGPLWRQLPDLLTPDGRVCLVTGADLNAPETLARLGYAITLQTQIRLAGRVSHLVLFAPPGRVAPAIPVGAATWRGRALADGVVTDDGF